MDNQPELGDTFVVLRDTYRLVALHPSTSTIYVLEKDLLARDERSLVRYMFWVKVLAYALYCHNFQVSNLVGNMLASVFLDALRRDFDIQSKDPEIVRLRVEAVLIGRGVLSKFEKDFSRTQWLWSDPEQEGKDG